LSELGRGTMRGVAFAWEEAVAFMADWPQHRGRDHQVGPTDDAGPTRSEFVWKTALGRQWHSHLGVAVVSDGDWR
jgi:hypothetical protein